MIAATGAGNQSRLLTMLEQLQHFFASHHAISDAENRGSRRILSAKWHRLLSHATKRNGCRHPAIAIGCAFIAAQAKRKYLRQA
jgi:hypothetical protein